MDADAIEAQFTAAASSYGGWHRRYAERLIELTPLAAGQRVLDVGTGTGFAAFAAARVVGPSGRVVGIDIADGMVAEARRIAGDVPNVEFQLGDGANLPFAAGSFDAIICSSAVIYLPLPDAVHEWWRVLRSSGIGAFSTLRHDAPRPGVVFREVAASFGLDLENPNAIGTSASCRALMEVAGFDDISITEETIQGGMLTPNAAWRANAGSAAFAAIRALPPATLERMRAAYLATLTAGDLDTPYEVMFVVARRDSN